MGDPVDSAEARGAVGSAAAVIAGYGMNLVHHRGNLDEDQVGPLKGKDPMLAVQARGGIAQIQKSDETCLIEHTCHRNDHRGRACSHRSLEIGLGGIVAADDRAGE